MVFLGVEAIEFPKILNTKFYNDPEWLYSQSINRVILWHLVKWQKPLQLIAGAQVPDQDRQ